MRFRSLLRQYKPALAGIAFFSAIINVLMLTGALFMLEVYDRVLPSRSIPTLVALGGLVVALYLMQALLDLVRGRLFIRIAGAIDEEIAPRAHVAGLRLTLAGRHREGLEAMRDLDQIRRFLAGGGPGALFDLPWIPFYLAVCFAFHFWIGATATIGAGILVMLTVLAERRTKRPMQQAAEAASQRNTLIEAVRRNAETIAALGMGERFSSRFAQINSEHLDRQQAASDTASGLGAISKSLRMMLQSAVLGVGAWLVIRQEATAGIIIASSILSARALAPVDVALANWKNFQQARQGWSRIATMLSLAPALPTPLPLAAPRQRLDVEGISVLPPRSSRPSVEGVTFQLSGGSALGIIGPSGSGKSSLVRALVGVWPVERGTIRLDGAALGQWNGEALGRHIGYLPQEVTLMEGSVAENIARFDPEASPEAIVNAARSAGVHDMILRLPDGYDTPVGQAGSHLSAGQRQRVALARALYGEPFLLVLDEPNSNLDQEGETALTEAILDVRRRGGIAVVVAHRPSALAAVDQVLVLAEGRVQSFGARDEVLSRVLKPAAPAARLASSA